GFPLIGTSAGDYAGFSGTGVGDVNGDGIEDMLIGAPGATAGGHFQSGIAYVVFGSSATTPLPLATVAGGTRGFPILGFEPSGLVGWATSAAGDVNGDGLMDVMIGCYTASPNMIPAGGEVLLVYGKASGSAVNGSNIRAGTGPGISYQGAY